MEKSHTEKQRHTREKTLTVGCRTALFVVMFGHSAKSGYFSDLAEMIQPSITQTELSFIYVYLVESKNVNRYHGSLTVGVHTKKMSICRIVSNIKRSESQRLITKHQHSYVVYRILAICALRFPCIFSASFFLHISFYQHTASRAQ